MKTVHWAALCIAAVLSLQVGQPAGAQEIPPGSEAPPAEATTPAVLPDSTPNVEPVAPPKTAAPANAFPASPSPAPRPSPPPALPRSGGTFQLVVYFFLLIGLFAGGVYLLRNGVALFSPKAKGPRKLNISETRVLGNRQFLVVAEYENRKILIGVCPGRIEYLCTLSGAEPEFPPLEPEPEDV